MDGDYSNRGVDKTSSIGKKSIAIASRILQRPLVASVVLLLIAVGLEAAQYWPEIAPGGHVLSVVVRNLAHALLAAIVFGWLVVEVPKRVREERTYSTYSIHFRALIGMGSEALIPYRYHARGPEVKFDSWDLEELKRAARTIAAQDPSFFGENRTNLMSTYILSATMTQQTLAPLVGFMAEDIAQAVLDFPNDWRLDALQIALTDEGTIDPARDAYLVWRLLEGSRAVYSAIMKHSPELMQGTVFEVVLLDGTKVAIEDPELRR